MISLGVLINRFHHLEAEQVCPLIQEGQENPGPDSKERLARVGHLWLAASQRSQVWLDAFGDFEVGLCR
ncbi:hypothetical protein CMK13_01770 [Candidatus Poribacteria bacterium]|jgi:hypothetical protein|nr:hypothetical protein [Candidatus Poribacteria bacterium]OUW01938.1 MAG: hypothetical protein CBD16_04740 [Betaproteobacteria bacterium TMED156]